MPVEEEESLIWFILFVLDFHPLYFSFYFHNLT